MAGTYSYEEMVTQYVFYRESFKKANIIRGYGRYIPNNSVICGGSFGRGTRFSL